MGRKTAKTLLATGALALTGALAALVPATAAGASESEADAIARGGAQGNVYAISNAPAGNDLLVWDRAADGALTAAPSVATGGLGTGAGLGSQGAVAVSRDHRWVAAVSAGSDQVSLFATGPGGPKLVETVGSGGDQPVSVTVSGDLLYVLNSGNGNNIAGFRISGRHLVPIPGSVRGLSQAGAGGAQVQFTPNGRQLVVTEKATNRIDVFAVGAGGAAGAAKVNASTGPTPFGFDFDNRGRLFVSNAGGGANNSSLSSYDIHPDGTAMPLDGPDSTRQSAACWVAVDRSGRFVYSANAGSASLSGFRIGFDGSVSLLNADGVSGHTGAGATDLAFSGNFLYTLNARADTISIHRQNPDGSLTEAQPMVGVPATAVGMAAS